MSSTSSAMTTTTRKPTATLLDLPGEILSKIAAYSFHPIAPSGLLRKADKRNWDASEGLTHQEWLQVFDDYIRALVIDLNFLSVNRKFYHTGIDVLYRINILTFTSRELAELSRKPGLVNFLRQVHVHERVLAESIWTGLEKSEFSQEEGEAVIRRILTGARLRSLVVDIEPFFIAADETNPDAFRECNKDGVQRVLRTFGLSDVAQWRCKGVAYYAIAAKSGRESQNLTAAQLDKLNLWLPAILRKWLEAEYWSPHGEVDVRGAAWLPRLGPFDPAWFRLRSTIRQMRRPRHRLLSWMFCLRYDTRDMDVDDTKRAVYEDFMREQVPPFAFEGAEIVESGELLPGRGCSRADHIWTAIFVSRRTDAYNMDLVESKAVARMWMLG